MHALLQPWWSCSQWIKQAECARREWLDPALRHNSSELLTGMPESRRKIRDRES
jgi:hypothetical protein